MRRRCISSCCAFFAPHRRPCGHYFRRRWVACWRRAQISLVLAQLLTFPAREKPRREPHPAAARSRCSCARRRSTTTTRTSGSPRSVTCSSIMAQSTLEADRVIYDQKTKRLHAEGNVRLTAARRHGHLSARSWISATIFATASWICCVPTRRSRRVCAPRGRNVPATISPCSTTASIPPASLQGRPTKAAEMAGQGRPHHARSEREDDVFRGCPPGGRGRAAGLCCHFSPRRIRQ